MNFKNNRIDILNSVLAFVSIAFVGFFLFTTIKRLFFPYDLEWMEGDILLHGVRLLEGKPLFAPPNAEFIPYMYTPFYYVVLAGMLKIFGVHLWVGRLIGIFSGLGIAFLLYKIIDNETDNYVAGLTAGGLFLASYCFTGAWMDLVRGDTFQLFLLMYAFYLLRYYSAKFWGIFLSAVVFALAHFTKQSAPIFIGVAFLILLKEDRKKLPLFFISNALLIGGGTLIINYLTDNWFWFYTFTTLQHYKFNPLFFYHYFVKDLLRNMPFICLATIGWYCYQFKELKKKEGVPFFWSMVFVAGTFASILMRSKAGGYTNSYLNLCCVIALMAGFILARSTKFKPWLRYAVGIILLLQFYRFTYNPLNQLPSQADRLAGDSLIERVASFSGPVLVSAHPFYTFMAGKETHLNDCSLRDVLFTGHDMPKDLVDKIQQHYYSAIILDEYPDILDTGHPLRLVVEKSYYLAEEIFKPGDESFYPATGYGVRPNYLFLPKPLSSEEVG